jgi:hypothetical protein
MSNKLITRTRGSGSRSTDFPPLKVKSATHLGASLPAALTSHPTAPGASPSACSAASWNGTATSTRNDLCPSSRPFPSLTHSTVSRRSPQRAAASISRLRSSQPGVRGRLLGSDMATITLGSSPPPFDSARALKSADQALRGSAVTAPSGPPSVFSSQKGAGGAAASAAVAAAEEPRPRHASQASAICRGWLAWCISCSASGECPLTPTPPRPHPPLRPPPPPRAPPAPPRPAAGTGQGA